MFRSLFQRGLRSFGSVGLLLLVAGVVGASGAPTPLPLATVVSSQDVVRFQVQKAGVESFQVEIFDLSGRSV